MFNRELSFNVLIVDDSHISRLIIRHVLRDCGITGAGVHIVEAQNGQEGLEAATKSRTDLIFSDLHMPMLNGIEMIEQLQACQSLMPPVIFITSETSTEWLDRAAALGPVGVIAKPFTQVAFREILRRALANKARA